MIFNHLHCHTQFSLLDGAADISKMLKKAKADGMTGCAITDHGNMFGVFKFVAEAAKIGIKPIVGCEFYLVADRHKRSFTKGEKDVRYHQLLLAKNDEGYRNLIKMCSLGFIEGLYGKYPRIDKELIVKYHKGLIATTCCLGAEVPRTILKYGEEEGEKVFKWWLDIFGEDYYVELQNHGIPDQLKANAVLLKFAEKYNVKIIASNDSHYVEQDDANAHDILLCINTGEKQSTPSTKEISDDADPSEFKGKRFAFFNDQFFFKNTAQMSALFKDLPQSIDNTNEIVDKCYDIKLKRDILLPNYIIPENFPNQDAYLRYLTYEGARRKYEEVTPKIQERLDFELSVVEKMGFAGYFLIVQDYINAGRDLGVLIGPGRGSAAGSAIAYCIGITNIDPIKYDLLFERFLNPDRKSMPDIDTDFDDEGRQKVIDYVVDKYGKNQVAQIVTYGSMAAKMSIKDVARVMDLPLGEANMLAKMVPEKPGIQLNRVILAPLTAKDGEKSLEEKEGLMADDLEEIKKLREIFKNKDTLQAKVLESALRLEGSVRNTGIHAAGIIIAPQDLTTLIPVATAKDSDLLVTQFEGKVIEDAGVIKMDFLGLKNLTIIRDALKMIKQNHGITIEIDEVPLDDKKTYEVYQKGKTNGTFQFESMGMQKYLKELKPDKFEDLIAMNALYRPGPLAYIPNYINRKHGREAVEYDLPEMEEFLASTYGICVSGDTLIYNPLTGESVRIDCLKEKVGEFYVQGVDSALKEAYAPITHWICNGSKPVFEVKLSNGSKVKLTDNHQVLTENGWKMIGELSTGDFIATPRKLALQNKKEHNREELRILAYIIAEGALSGCATSADFVSKDDKLIDEYKRCVNTLERVEVRTLMQIREVTRVMVTGVDKTHYHETNSLVALLRKWGLKTMTGGCTSDTKFIPDFVFQLNEQDIAFFLASLWDCDGHIGKRHCFLKTISPKLANDVKTLLLRIGIHATIYTTQYQNNRREQEMTAFQISVYNLRDFRDKISPYLVSKKMYEESNFGGHEWSDAVSRETFMAEFTTAWKGSKRGFMAQYGFSRQHLHPQAQNRQRIGACVIEPVTQVLDLPQTQKNLNVRWVEIESITPLGEELVYDITVADIHNFVGNNIILHNCVYQEQVMLLSQKLAHFTKGEADILRKAMGKKDKATLDKMKTKFMEGCASQNFDLKVCEKVWTDWEAFASYAFNKSHSTCYAFVAFQTMYLKAHYPAEYMASVLTHNSSNITKITFFIEECKSMGIPVLPPDVNESGVLFAANKKGEIRFGMGAIKGVGEAVVEKIIEEREANGPFTSLYDMFKRLPARTLNKKVLESLAYAGALDLFKIERYRYFMKYSVKEETTMLEKLLLWGTKLNQDKNSSQSSLFGGGSSDFVEAEPQFPSANLNEAWSRLQELKYEKEVIGFYLSGHPMEKYRWQIEAFPSIQQIAVLQDPENDRKPINVDIKLAGIVSNFTEKMTGTGKKFITFSLEDFSGTMEMSIFPFGKDDLITKFKPLLQNDSFVLITGSYQPRYNDPTAFEFKIKDVISITDELMDGMIKQLILLFETMDISEALLKDLEKIVVQHKAVPNKPSLPLRFRIRDSVLNKYVDLESQIRIQMNKQAAEDIKGLGVEYLVN